MEPEPRTRRVRRIACVLLLLTLVLPFSRCSNATPAAGSSSTDGSTEQHAAPAVQPPPPEAWYRALVGPLGRPSSYEYTYGYEIFLRIWDVPPKFDPVLLVPGRMFHVWPFVTLFLFRFARIRATRMGLYAAEIVLAIGAIWWAAMGALLRTALSGFYLAVVALGLYAAAAAWDGGREIRAWRREKKIRRSELDGETLD